MVAAPVGAHDLRDEPGERALDERRVVDEVEARLGPLGARTPGERSDSVLWLSHRTLTPYVLPSWRRPHIFVRRSTEISTSGGSSDTDMNALAVMPWTCSPTRVVMIVTPVANIPSVLRSADARVVALDLERLGARAVVERRLADPVGPGGDGDARQGQVEFGGRVDGTVMIGQIDT